MTARGTRREQRDARIDAYASTRSRRVPDISATFHDPRPKGSCPSGKDRFATEHDAGLALVSCMIARVLHHKHKRKERRIYCCTTCRGWHLTSTAESR